MASRTIGPANDANQLDEPWMNPGSRFTDLTGAAGAETRPGRSIVRVPGFGNASRSDMSAVRPETTS